VLFSAVFISSENFKNFITIGNDVEVWRFLLKCVDVENEGRGRGCRNCRRVSIFCSAICRGKKVRIIFRVINFIVINFCFSLLSFISSTTPSLCGSTCFNAGEGDAYLSYLLRKHLRREQGREHGHGQELDLHLKTLENCIQTRRQLLTVVKKVSKIEDAVTFLNRRSFVTVVKILVLRKYCLKIFYSYRNANAISYDVAFNSHTVCNRAEQVSYFFPCALCLHLLSDRTIIVSYTISMACLGRSFPAECLNIIELHTMFKSFLNNINFNFFKVEIYFLIVSDKQSSLRKVFRGSKGKVHESEKKFNSKICSYYTFGLRTLKLKLLQLCGDIECNPGPCKGNPELILMTQNCRGLQDYNKMRLLLRNKNAAMNKGKLVLALQETHLMNDDLIKWSGNYAFSSSASPHSAGCITYFNDYVRILEVRQIDNLGHGHVAVVEGLTVHIAIIANVYSPVRSLGREQDRFYEHLMTIVDELEQKYLFNEPNLMILGDFNLPLELNRNSHGNDLERERAKSLVEHFDSKGLIDCWKLNDERYTFRTAQSRLDRILYRMNTVYMEELETDWTFTNSDHCLLKLSLCSTRGKAVHTRVVSLPMYLLENEEAVKMINDKMTDMASDCLDHWEPGMKLEYLKMSLRTTVGEVTKLLNKRVNDDLEAIKKSITWRMGRMRSLPLHAWEENNMQLELLFTRRNLILDERSKKLAEKAKTKWFHEGEKANKYFLNLLNKRKGLNVIEKLVTDRGEITNDDEIDDEINTFYKNLYERGEPLGSNIDNNFYEHIVKVNNADAAKVISPLSKEEIFEVLSSCKDSAPGPDGIPYSYYRKFWFFFGDIIAQVWDAKKAFDSVSHDYIRKTLTEFGLGDFVPIFNLLYDKQKVNINVNGRMLDGYEICNGVKQGDSLSCILFIMCMDPLIRNIEMNANITRVDIRNIPFPKAVAYADDITCIIENNEANLQGIFDEYERLSKASGLSLNAEKTEILDNNASSFRVRYGNETHRIQGVRSVKINGVVYNKDTRQMREDNFNHLVAKIDNMLRGWRARNLSLLGKILIYKTFGLSQVIYVLSVIHLNHGIWGLWYDTV